MQNKIQHVLTNWNELKSVTGHQEQLIIRHFSQLNQL